MKAVRCLMLCLLLPVCCALPALADDIEEQLEKDARTAESAPPVVPHKIEPHATSEACLACHREGIKGAPATPHPERLDCVQCHVQGEVKVKKGKKTKK